MFVSDEIARYELTLLNINLNIANANERVNIPVRHLVIHASLMFMGNDYDCSHYKKLRQYYIFLQNLSRST